MKQEFLELYNIMANSNNVENMHTFGEVQKKMFGWFAANKPDLAQEYLDELSSIEWDNYLTAREADKIIAGMKDFVAAKGDFRDPDFNKQFKISPDRINDAFNAYLEKRHNYILLENKDKGDKFLAANRKKAGVQETESGLQYKIIEPGNDNKPADVDTVWVKYKGTLIDGTVFDETAEDAEPISFPLKSVVAGWTEGM